MENIAKKLDAEKKTVGLMIRLYCNANHGTKAKELCSECKALTNYAHERVDHCPFMETKTFCSSCKKHCYEPEMREKIRKVMRWSGPRMIFHRPVLAIRYLITKLKSSKEL